uniref:Uncharacterized protein n=1 Tax=Avena sativa TaxID=4498 RepID=A0ACD5TNW0_AVESA
MEATANLGANRIIFESDSSNLVAAIKTGAYDLADTGILFKEARSLCTLHFDLADVVLCRRTCNSVAHWLAQFGYQGIAPYSTWEEDVPDFVIGLVVGDSAKQHV